MFINETLVSYCEDRDIEFTRSRAYRKNDQAWIEQKNGSVILRFVGHERYSGAIAGQALAHLYGGYAPVRELLPALVPAPDQEPERRECDQALQQAGHTLRSSAGP